MTRRDEAQLRPLLGFRLAVLAAPGSNVRSVDTSQRASGANSNFFAPLRLPRQRALPRAARRSPRLPTTWLDASARPRIPPPPAGAQRSGAQVGSKPRGEQQGGEPPQRSSAWRAPVPALPPAERWGGGAPMRMEGLMAAISPFPGHTPSPAVPRTTLC